MIQLLYHALFRGKVIIGVKARAVGPRGAFGGLLFGGDYARKR